MTSKTKRNSEDSEPGCIIEEKLSKPNGENSVRRYNKGRFLGKGGFARCYEFTMNDSHKLTAAKIIPKASLSKSRAKQKLMSEIKIHRSLHHPNIVGFEHFFEDSENVYIMLELCTNQTMNELLRRRKRLTELEVQCYLAQVISALKYLHTHRVIHRDLKLGNLFLSDKMEVKVGDFGLAAKLEFDGERKRTICGTPNYIAPEVLDGKQGHSYEVDVWALGVIAYTMLVGKPPFETSDVKTTYRRIRMNSYSFPDNLPLSEQSKNLISQILVVDPNKRPSLDDMLNHPFFNQGYPFPKLLPPSTLACPPSSMYLDQFQFNLTRQSSSPTNRRLNETAPLESFKITRHESLNSERIPRFREEHKFLLPRHKMNDTGPEIYVKKWVDYSAKYGLGYLLSDGAIGVCFNDSSKLILLPAGKRINYIVRQGPERQDVASTYSLTDYPNDLKKKMTLLQHFKSYLEGEVTLDIEVEDDDDISNQFYMKKWMRTRHAIMFRLSNKVVQVNFQDHTELILATDIKTVTYVDKRGERNTYPMAVAEESSNQEMTKRLKYTKDILNNMVNPSKNTEVSPLE